MSNIIKTNKLTQLVGKSTRISPVSSTLIDLVITNKPDAVLSCDVVPVEIADHELISVVLDVSKPKRQTTIRTFRCLSNYSNDAFCFSLLRNVDSFNRILMTDNVNSQVNIFNTAFNECLNECAPFVTKEVRRPFAPWMNDELRGAMRIRNDIGNQLKCDRNNIVLQDRYKHEKRNVKSLIAGTKAQHYNSIFNDNRGNT